MAQRKQKAKIPVENENKPYISTSVSPGPLLPTTALNGFSYAESYEVAFSQAGTSWLAPIA